MWHWLGHPVKLWALNFQSENFSDDMMDNILYVNIKTMHNLSYIFLYIQ